MKNTAIYPGTFDPVTFGHIDIIKRALEIFDKLYVAVASNTNKKPIFSADERKGFIQRATRNWKGVTVETFDGLIVDYAAKKGTQVMIRGMRATSDFDYEFQMALTNRKLNKDIQTVFLIPSEQNFYLSSSLIREVARLGGKIRDFVPAYIEGQLIERLRGDH
ncbi:MAG: pantetheine-phosphate adenylyltransferase [Candidatus Omnitrophica bacterium]|nr:pantetheine-phosphate adenylyltransferase [Candidatus Omnitrophota bacterium]